MLVCVSFSLHVLLLFLSPSPPFLFSLSSFLFLSLSLVSFSKFSNSWFFHTASVFPHCVFSFLSLSISLLPLLSHSFALSFFFTSLCLFFLTLSASLSFSFFVHPSLFSLLHFPIPSFLFSYSLSLHPSTHPSLHHLPIFFPPPLYCRSFLSLSLSFFVLLFCPSFVRAPVFLPHFLTGTWPPPSGINICVKYVKICEQKEQEYVGKQS